MKQKKNTRGFTLTEMLITISSLAVIAAAATPKILALSDHAAKASLEGMRGAITTASQNAYLASRLKGKHEKPKALVQMDPKTQVTTHFGQLSAEDISKTIEHQGFQFFLLGQVVGANGQKMQLMGISIGEDIETFHRIQITDRQVTGIYQKTAGCGLLALGPSKQRLTHSILAKSANSLTVSQPFCNQKQLNAQLDKQLAHIF